MSFAGRFITIEGVEGVGKTTQIAFIVDWLTEKGYDVVQTREPGGTDLGESLRGLVLDAQRKISHETELLLMFAARSDHWCSKIRPALARGSWVVSDRFTDATYAYQGGGRGIPQETIASLENLVLGDARPDLTLLLDVPDLVAANRVERRGNKDRFEAEQAEFFQRVRQAYLDRAASEPERIKVIDGDQPVSQVHATVAQVLTKFWEGHSF